MKRLTAAIAAALLTFTVVSPASAETASSITIGGESATLVDPNTSVVLTTDAAVTVAGTTDQVITQMFDLSAGAVKAKEIYIEGDGWYDVPDIIAPQGYTLEYYYDGDWHTELPPLDGESYTYPSLEGVRATGSMTVDGYANGLEQVSRFAEAKPGRVDGFQGSSGGDGWDVFFGTGAAKDLVFNIYHHSFGNLGIDCHERRQGNSCWGGSFIVSGDYYSSARSTGFYVEASDSVYTFIASAGTLGMACFTDVSTAQPRECDTFYTALTGNVGAGYTTAGTALEVDGKVYARGAYDGANLLCFDLGTEAPCAENPIDLGSPTSGSRFVDNYLVAHDDRIFFNTYYKLGCYDISEAGLCSTFNSGSTLTTSSYGPLFYTLDTDGDLSGVCSWNTQSCWGMDGQAADDPAGLTWTNFSGNAGWGSTYNWKDRLFYASGDYSQCYNFTTAAPCDGFQSTQQGGYMYAFAGDPYNAKCMWTNSDRGVIKTFDPYTGEAPCGQTQIVFFNYPDTIPRLSCSDEGNVSAYHDMVLNAPDGLDLADARITVYDTDGSVIDGWNEVTVDPTTGLLDLSTLTVLESGVHPTFKVEFIGATDAGGTSGVFTYDAAPPQMCTGFVTHVNPCPEGVGSGAGDFPFTPNPILLNSTVSNTNGGQTVTETAEETASRKTVQAVQCLAAVQGFVRIDDAAGAPAPNVRVTLYDADGNVVATAVTGPDGFYRFPDMYPGVYFSATRNVTSDALNIYNGQTNELTVLVLTADDAAPKGPSEPQNVTAVPGKTSFTVSWTAPADPGDGDIVSYTVTAEPGGASCTVLAPKTSCVINGLDPKVKYTFTVTATSTVGTGGASAGTPAAKPLALKVAGKVYARVYFAPLSSKLDKKAKFELRKLVNALPKGAKITGVRVVGYVQLDGKNANNESLSKDRVRYTKQYLQKRGVRAVWKLEGKGILGSSPWARTAAVTIKYVVTP